MTLLDRYAIDETDGSFIVVIDTSSGVWMHAVMVYHGVGLGITVYNNGTEVGTDTEKSAGPKPNGNGHVLIGNREGNRYASVSVDEINFTRQLSQEEIGNMDRRL